MSPQPVYSLSPTSPDPLKYNHRMMGQQRYMQENHPSDNSESAWNDEDIPESYSPAPEDYEDRQENFPPWEWEFEDDGQSECYPAADEESDEPQPLSDLVMILHDAGDEEELEDLDGEYVLVRDISFLEVSERSGQEQDSNLKEETILKHLKTRQHRTSEADQDGDDEDGEICVVCQSQFEDKETIVKLGCGHEYHSDCVKTWLQHKNVCPICKRTAVTQESS